jgi:S1-C subfamily serine protease
MSGSGVAAAQVDLPKLIKQIQPAVVTVIGYDAQRRIIRLGSGFFINQQGHLITNVHVLAGVSQAEVKTLAGGRYPLKTVLAEDRRVDLIKLAVELPQGPPHFLAVSASLPEVGERVLVIGSPLGLEQTVSDGMVSGIRQVAGRGQILQISAPVSPGSSGGPVVNLKGEVLGVATFQMGRGQNLNFAVPGKMVLELKDGPPRPLTGREGVAPPAAPGTGVKPGLPPRPQMLVPPSRLQLPAKEAPGPEPPPLSPVPPAGR